MRDPDLKHKQGLTDFIWNHCTHDIGPHGPGLVCIECTFAWIGAGCPKRLSEGPRDKSIPE